MPAIAHQNKILGNTSGGGSTILVTTSESTLYGQTVTLSDGTTTLTGTFSNAGECEFTGVMMVGTLTATSGTASTSINVPYFGVYSIILSLFSATITATYPEDKGATCTCTGNGESYTASGSPYTFTVHGAGEYRVTATLDGKSITDVIQITTDGQSETATINFGTIVVTYDNAFRGLPITCTKDSSVYTKTAPSSGNTMYFYPNITGNWVISGTVSGTSYSKTANVTSLSTSVSVSLETVPDGKTTTPTDDIEKWLQCGQITGKSYTTLSQVLADAETYERLLSDSNACDYMARSTTWASTICADADAMMRLGKYDYACYALLGNVTWASAIVGSSYADYVISSLVPTMTSNTAPSGECFASTVYDSSGTYFAYKAFDNNSSTYWGPSSSDTLANIYIGYSFPTSVRAVKARLGLRGTRISKGKIQATSTPNDPTSWVDLTDEVTFSTSETGLWYADVDFTKNINTYTSYRLKPTELNVGSITGVSVYEIQLYGRQIAQTDIVVSAPESYVYYMQDGSPVNLCYTDSDGIGTIDWSDLPKGEITLYSSVAKDPDNLSNDYSKTVKINENTTEIYLMPEGALYWYGYNGGVDSNFIRKNSTGTSTITKIAPIYNTNDIQLSSADNQDSYVGCSKHTYNSGTIKSIAQGVTAYSNVYGFAYLVSSTTFGQTGTIIGSDSVDSTNDELLSVPITQAGYVVMDTSSRRTFKVKALWIE